jgi:hypothetical protein
MRLEAIPIFLAAVLAIQPATASQYPVGPAPAKRSSPPLTPAQKAEFAKMEQAMVPTPAEKKEKCAYYLNNLIVYVHSGIDCGGEPGWGPAKSGKRGMNAWEAIEASENGEAAHRGEKRRIEVPFTA